MVHKEEVVRPEPNQGETAPSPALVPEPTPHTEHSYIVQGTNEVHGHQPGEVFTMLIPADQEALLIESGALVRHETKEEGE